MTKSDTAKEQLLACYERVKRRAEFNKKLRNRAKEAKKKVRRSRQMFGFKTYPCVPVKIDKKMKAYTGDATEVATVASTEVATEVATVMATEMATEVATEVFEFDKNEPPTEGFEGCSNIKCEINGFPRREVSESGYGHTILGKHSGFNPNPKMARCGCEKQRLLSKSLKICLRCKGPINVTGKSVQSELFHQECYDEIPEHRFPKCPYCNLKVIPGGEGVGVGVDKNATNPEKIFYHEQCHLNSQKI
jgi:hypothetical protein